jgi:hypothetical protein
MFVSDFRRLPKRPELEPLMAQVESLGITCELGLVQRHCLAEPLGLFRFAYTPLEGLVTALHEGFEGIGDPAQIELRTGADGQWVSLHKRYGFECHTRYFPASHTESLMRKKLSVHYPALARNLRDALTSAEKLFVYRPATPGAAGDEARTLLEAMHRFGRPVLLWIDETDDPRAVGTAEWTIPHGLMTGYLDRYAPIEAAESASFDAWIGVVSAALELWRRPLSRDSRTGPGPQAHAHSATAIAQDMGCQGG